MNSFVKVVITSTVALYGIYAGWLMFGEGSFLGRQGGAFVGVLMGGLAGAAWGLVLANWGSRLSRGELQGAMAGALWLALHLALVNGLGGALLGLAIGSICGKELAHVAANSRRTASIVAVLALLALLEGLFVAMLLAVLRWFT